MASAPTVTPDSPALDGVRLTSLDKVLYPSTGLTKGEVIAYYATVAPALLPHLAGRPVTRKRWVHGVGTAKSPGEVFFHKNLDDSTPDWVHRTPVQHRDHTNDYPLVDDIRTLVWLAQLATLELHVPQWRVAPGGARQNPDRLVLDLDPGEGAGLPECAEVARRVRRILVGMGLEPLPVTSGSTGIHLYAHLDGTQTSEQVSAVAHELARALQADDPGLVVSDMTKSLRAGKVLVDWSQNNGNKTTISPYSLRGRLRPTVAAPRDWSELDDPGLAQLEFDEVLRRMTRHPDPLAPLAPPPPPSADRLAQYRSMRSSARTPEPVPADPPAPGPPTGAPTFVIQEHHARRLHWDFRLEHDGVLVSWALPKGVPTDGTRNHLAVQTEDHPLQYGSFAGTIPHGEYGAGEVTIWDSGTTEIAKWRDDEVIATLHSATRGSRTYALVRTRTHGERDWLIHLMHGGATGAAAGATAGATATSVTGDAATGEAAQAEPAPGSAAPDLVSLRPMLATAGTLADVGGTGWIHEFKLDGIRALASTAAGAVRLASRSGRDITATYPELAVLTEALGGREAILDGEIVALGDSGRPDFGRLQERMNLASAREVERVRASTPVVLMLFDLLALDGHDLRGEPLAMRRRMLEQAVTATKAVQLPPVAGTDASAALEASRSLRLEGIVAKRADSPYRDGERGRAWRKVKFARQQSVLVIGWRRGQGGRASTFGSLLLAVHDDAAPGHPDGALRYVGRVGTGFSDRDLSAIRGRLEPLVTRDPTAVGVPPADARDATWVRPQLVGEVQFAEWTSSGHLRQPVWRGLRPDLDPDSVTREENP